MSESTPVPQLPVAVIGAGPVGLAAAARLIERGIEPVVLEAGPSAATAVREWSHVRLFSQWSELVDPAAEKLLAPTGWVRPDADAYPLGGDWVAQYLQPLADVLGDRVRYDARVTGVARAGRDRIVDADRAAQPFTVHLRHADGSEERVLARAVIDASGTWSTPGPAGGNGLPALGERAASSKISYYVPDFADPDTRKRYAGKRTAVVGSGASAFTALALLADLAQDEPGTHAVWVLRRGISGSTYGGGTADQLPARGALGLRAKSAVEAGHAGALTGFRTTAVEPDGEQLVLVAEDGQRSEAVDEIIVLTGFRPDLSFLGELRLGLDERLQAPLALADLIDPNQHSCGTVYPHGAAELSHPEKDVYLVGMKSYGRAPTFLALTGYEQVRSIAAALAGDHEAAARVELTLPETGVCGGAGLFDDASATQGGSCCTAPAAEPETVTTQTESDCCSTTTKQQADAGGCCSTPADSEPATAQTESDCRSTTTEPQADAGGCCTAPADSKPATAQTESDCRSTTTEPQADAGGCCSTPAGSEPTTTQTESDCRSTTAKQQADASSSCSTPADSEPATAQTESDCRSTTAKQQADAGGCCSTPAGSEPTTTQTESDCRSTTAKQQADASSSCSTPADSEPTTTQTESDCRSTPAGSKPATTQTDAGGCCSATAEPELLTLGTKPKLVPLGAQESTNSGSPSGSCC